MNDLQRPLRIATYNIRRAIGSDGQTKPERIAKVLQEVNPDIVALQEVGYHSGIPGNLLEYLGASMQARVLEGVTFEDERGCYGNVVLSRLCVSDMHLHDISVDGREPRGAIELDLQVNGNTVQILATHLGLWPGERRHQVEQLLKVVGGSSADTNILMGDLNEWFMWGRPLRHLRQAFGRMPEPASFPVCCPFLALDRVWVRPVAALGGLRAHRSSTARRASDHLPLLAEICI